MEWTVGPCMTGRKPNVLELKAKKQSRASWRVGSLIQPLNVRFGAGSWLLIGASEVTAGGNWVLNERCCIFTSVLSEVSNSFSMACIETELGVPLPKIAFSSLVSLASTLGPSDNWGSCSL